MEEDPRNNKLRIFKTFRQYCTTQHDLKEVIEFTRKFSYTQYIALASQLEDAQRSNSKSKRLYYLLYIMIANLQSEEDYLYMKLSLLLMYYNFSMFHDGLLAYEVQEEIASFLKNKIIGSYVLHFSLDNNRNDQLDCTIKTESGVHTIPIQYRIYHQKMTYTIKDKYTSFSLEELHQYLTMLSYQYNPLTLDIQCKKDNTYELEMYTNYKPVGSGSFGTVYSAQSILDRSMVAIKFSNRNPSIENEYHMLRHLQQHGTYQHPTLIHMITYLPCVKVDDKSQFALVLDYASHGDAFDLIERIVSLPTPYPFDMERLVRTLFLQMVDAVVYCHAHDVVHLDVKLENIILDEQWNVKLSDFGSAQLQVPFQTCTQMMGTIRNYPPEISINRSTGFNGKKVDTFCLGIILFILLFHIPPFSESSEKDPYYTCIINHDFEQFFRFHRLVIDTNDVRYIILSQLLDPNPENRAYASDIKGMLWSKGEIYTSQKVKEILDPLYTTQDKMTGKKQCNKHKKSVKSVKKNTIVKRIKSIKKSRK